MTELKLGSPPPAGALREWRSGWAVVLAGVFGFALLSLGSAAMGTFMAPVTAGLGFSRGQFSAGLTAYAIVGIVMGPLVGVLIDRWGERVVAIAGSLLVGATFSLFATANGSFAYWLLLWLLYAAANQLIMTTVWWAAVSRVFNASRGLAISVTIIGTGLAVQAAPYFANLLIKQQGWRPTFVITGLGTGTVVALICWLALRPAGPPSAAQVQTDPAPAATGPSLMEAALSVKFIMLAVASYLAYAVRLGVAFHLVPMLSAGGMARDTAVVIGGTYGLWMILGQIVSGAAMDHLPARWVSALWLAMMGASLALLMLPPHPISLPIVAVALFGTAMGGMAPTFPYLTTRYFGLRSFGKLFGIIASLSGLGFATGPLLAGRIFDVSNSYTPFLTLAIPALLLSALLISLLGRYPVFETSATPLTR